MSFFLTSTFLLRSKFSVAPLRYRDTASSRAEAARLLLEEGEVSSPPSLGEVSIGEVSFGGAEAGSCRILLICSRLASTEDVTERKASCKSSKKNVLSSMSNSPILLGENKKKQTTKTMFSAKNSQKIIIQVFSHIFFPIVTSFPTAELTDFGNKIGNLSFLLCISHHHY